MYVRKLKFWKAVIITAVSFGLTVACNNSFDTNIVITKKVISASDTTEKLAFYANAGNYIVTQDELQNHVLVALASSKKNPKDSRSISDITNDYKLLDITSEVYTIPETQKNTRSAIESYKDINLYAYHFENNQTHEKSYVLSCNDRRIGEIIAIADGQFNPDDDAPFIDIIKTGLEAHIKQTIDSWNNLSDEEIRSARSIDYSYITMYNFDYEFISATINADDLYTPFYRVILPTQWGQDSPSNDFVKICENIDCPSGCVAVALAQICANYKHPKYCSPEVLSLLKQNNCVPENWDGKYSYNDMHWVDHYIYTPKAYDLESKGQMNVATLMYDIGKGVNMSYGIYGSGATIEAAYEWLQQKEFYCTEILNYDYQEIERSITRGHPVYICGLRKIRGLIYSGHAWVIDDCGKYKLIFKNRKNNETFKIEDNFVHCNWGWNGLHNGFYLTELLNTAPGPLFRVEDRYEVDGDYSDTYRNERKDSNTPDDGNHYAFYNEGLKIISDIHPIIY